MDALNDVSFIEALVGIGLIVIAAVVVYRNKKNKKDLTVTQVSNERPTKRQP